MARFKKTKGKSERRGRLSLAKGFVHFLPLLLLGFVEVEAAHGMAGGGSGQQGGLAAFLPLILIVVIFYFLLIRPQTKRQKEHKMLLSTLRKGDKVVTNSGMFGTIVGMDDKENKVVLKVAENVKIEFLKSSIAGRVGAEE